MTQAPLVITSTTDTAEFARCIEALVTADPVVFSILTSNVTWVAADPSGYDDVCWFWGERNGQVVAAAMHTLPFPPHVPSDDEEFATALADHLAGTDRVVEGVTGSAIGTQVFARRWAEVRGVQFVVRRREAVFDLPVAPIAPDGVCGRPRVARDPDRDLVNGWAAAFAEEVHLPAGGHTALDAALDAGRVLLWEVDDEVRTMAAAMTPAQGLVRVGWVYTPPQHRRHGYAAACVAELSACVQRRGHRCMLYTDLANPTSNAIYQRIGYRRVGDALALGLP